MNVLVVNIGSTSFKFCLLDMADERVRARGGVEDVGRQTSTVRIQIDESEPNVTERSVPHQAAAVQLCLRELETASIDAVGFKAVHGGPIVEAVRVTPDVIRVMEEFSAAAPAHNPPYVAAMRAFADARPDTPLVAAFETAFHRTIPAARTTYAIPYTWTRDFGVRRYGFHGASHRYVAERTAERLGWPDLRVISCHLGGSSSVCAIRDGESVANSLGMTPQTGVPQNNRVGDFDPYALPVLHTRTGQSLDDLLAKMATEGGLLGISGVSNDMAAIIAAADAGNERAELALNVFVESVRDYVGAYLVALGGIDALVFTGGIGERSPEVRRRICRGLEFLGIRLDDARNDGASADAEVSPADATVKILALRTNEELIVARQTVNVLHAAGVNRPAR